MFPDAFLEVKSCSKAFLSVMWGHGKSPCFSQVAFLRLVSPDYRVVVLPCVDEEEFLECAF